MRRTLPMLNERRRYAVIAWGSQVWTCREKKLLSRTDARNNQAISRRSLHWLHCRWLRGPPTQAEYVWVLSLTGPSWLSPRSIKQQGQHIYLPFKNPFIHKTQARTAFQAHLYDFECTHEWKTHKHSPSSSPHGPEFCGSLAHHSLCRRFCERVITICYNQAFSGNRCRVAQQLPRSHTINWHGFLRWSGGSRSGPCLVLALRAGFIPAALLRHREGRESLS